MNIFRYSLAELFLLMAYCAVVVWCFQFNWIVGMLSLGAFIGVESGRKTNYAMLLMVPAGLIMATVFVVAIGGCMGFRFGSDPSFVKMLEQRLASSRQGSSLIFTLDVMTWLCAFSSLLWFIHAWSTLKDVSNSGEQSTLMRAELESIVKEKREAIEEGLASESNALDASN